MDEEELRSRLRNLEVGQPLVIPYDIYEQIFPPGEPDEDARLRCRTLAREEGCTIQNDPEGRTITFVRDGGA